MSKRKFSILAWAVVALLAVSAAVVGLSHNPVAAGEGESGGDSSGGSGSGGDGAVDSGSGE